MYITKNYIYRLIATPTVGVWGLTLISTRVLIGHGLSPQETLLPRSLMACLGIWLISPRKLFADSWEDELWLLWSGATDGSFYFFTENIALEITLVINAVFIVCVTLLPTTILSLLIYKKEKATTGLMGGSLLVLVGIALVVYNGHFVLRIPPSGDFLTLLAVFSWASYSLIMKEMSGRYRTTFIIRKVFFYGILVILPASTPHPWRFSLSGLWQSAVRMNLLFLDILASPVCFAVWNIVLKQLGTVRVPDYIYLDPLFTLIGSAVLLNEQFTVMSFMGAMLILGGVYWVGKR